MVTFDGAAINIVVRVTPIVIIVGGVKTTGPTTTATSSIDGGGTDVDDEGSIMLMCNLKKH